MMNWIAYSYHLRNHILIIIYQIKDINRNTHLFTIKTLKMELKKRVNNMFGSFESTPCLIF